MGMQEDRERAPLRSASAASTPSDTLRALADRCEREEPSRELDVAILVAKLGDGWCVSSAEGWACVPHQEIVEAPLYTTSLDAAVTLYKEKPATISTDPRKVCAEALRQWT